MLSGRPTFEMSKETEILVKILRGVNHDISEEALSSSAGFPINGSTAAVRSAMRYLESKEGIAFSRVRKQGWRRLYDVDKTESLSRNIGIVKRASGRGLKRAKCVEDFAAMPLGAQLKYSLYTTLLEAVKQATSIKNSPALPKVDNSGIAEALKAFRKDQTS